MLLCGEDLKKLVFKTSSSCYIKYLKGLLSLAMIKQFMNDVAWQNIDYLIIGFDRLIFWKNKIFDVLSVLIDTPPGTSDEHLSVLENIRQMSESKISAVLVSTPQVIK